MPSANALAVFGLAYSILVASWGYSSLMLFGTSIPKPEMMIWCQYTAVARMSLVTSSAHRLVLKDYTDRRDFPDLIPWNRTAHVRRLLVRTIKPLARDS
jgi:hypothetical protein